LSDSSSLKNTKHVLSFMGFVDSIHHSNHSAVLSSKPLATSSSQGVKNPPKEAIQAHPGVTSVHPASPATLPTNHTEARPSHYRNPTQPLCPPRSTTELGRILEPGYLGRSGQWDMMRPQKGSISGDLSSGSSMYQLNTKPTGKYKAEQSHLGSTPTFFHHQELLQKGGGVFLHRS
uniref:Uncharacterized protein n=1 Tax=Moschus moschiferus TaxID=68415 RepID=A0A8C6EDY9_MOSMO